MNISLEKKVTLGLMIFGYGMAIIGIYLTDTLRVTREELRRFYETRMDSCTIDRLETMKYPSRGFYEVFYTNCDADFYPIFIESGSPGNVRLGSLISKEPNSVDIRISDGKQTIALKIRHPDTEDDRGFSTLMILGFIGVITIAVLLTPDSQFKKLKGSN